MGAIEVSLGGTQRLTTTYYFAGGQRIAMRKAGEVTYLHGDHLGSASLATNASGAKLSDMRYTPFGEVRYGDAPTDRRFTGQREEAGIGLYDYGARYYSPSLGHFVSADSIVSTYANPQSLNRYSYVLNCPLRYVDPTGYFEVDELIAWFGEDQVNAWKEDKDWWNILTMAELDSVLYTVYTRNSGEARFRWNDEFSHPILEGKIYKDHYLVGKGLLELSEWQQMYPGVSYLMVDPSMNLHPSNIGVMMDIGGTFFDTVGMGLQVVSDIAFLTGIGIPLSVPLNFGSEVSDVAALMCTIIGDIGTGGTRVNWGTSELVVGGDTVVDLGGLVAGGLILDIPVVGTIVDTLGMGYDGAKWLGLTPKFGMSISLSGVYIIREDN